MSETQESKILYIRNTAKEKKDSPLEGVDEKLAALAWENHLKRLANGYPPEKAHNLLLEELKEKQGIGPSTNPNLPIENNPHEDYLELVKYLSGPKIEEMNEKNKLLEAFQTGTEPKRYCDVDHARANLQTEVDAALGALGSVLPPTAAAPATRVPPAHVDEAPAPPTDEELENGKPAPGSVEPTGLE
jgi:hypothetical protein